MTSAPDNERMSVGRISIISSDYQEKMDRYEAALRVICSVPLTEEDNQIAHNMRWVAAQALGILGTESLEWSKRFR